MLPWYFLLSPTAGGQSCPTGMPPTACDFGDVDGQGCCLDSDGDGINDSRDSCRGEKETRNGYKDSDGCPDTKPAPAPESSPAPTPSPSSTRRSGVGSYGYEMVEIPAGSFTMGSATSESGRDSDETQHKVTLTQSFLLGKTEVTQRLWYRVMTRRLGRIIRVYRCLQTTASQ